MEQSGRHSPHFLQINGMFILRRVEVVAIKMNKEGFLLNVNMFGYSERNTDIVNVVNVNMFGYRPWVNYCCTSKIICCLISVYCGHIQPPSPYFYNLDQQMSSPTMAFTLLYFASESSRETDSDVSIL